MARTKSLRCLLASVGWGILARLRAPLTEPIREVIDDKEHRVTIVVNSVNAAETKPPVRYPGVFLSSFELLVWNALGDEMLVAKEIAERIGKPYDTRLKYLLLNMEERGVLDHEDNKGYQRAHVADDNFQR